LRKLPFAREVPIPVHYKGLKLDCGYRVDLVVVDQVVVEVKAVERITTLHEAQFLTYLKMGGWKAGLMINFNVPLLRDGIVAARAWIARVAGSAQIEALRKPKDNCPKLLPRRGLFFRALSRKKRVPLIVRKFVAQDDSCRVAARVE